MMIPFDIIVPVFKVNPLFENPGITMYMPPVFFFGPRAAHAAIFFNLGRISALQGTPGAMYLLKNGTCNLHT